MGRKGLTIIGSIDYIYFKGDKMFLDDRPIKSEKEDLLGRKRFSESLAESIVLWKGEESLVIGLYGKWGSGKSSIINLCVEHLHNLKKEETPTIIEFNPWFFSGQEKINDHFFNEIARELEYKGGILKDKERANKLRLYSSAIDIIPTKQLPILLQNVFNLIASLFLYLLYFGAQ